MILLEIVFLAGAAAEICLGGGKTWKCFAPRPQTILGGGKQILGGGKQILGGGKAKKSK